MESLLKDLSFAVRSLGRNPGFALLTIVTLALGVGANTAIFSILNATLLRPLPYPDPARLIFVTSQFPGLGFDQFWVSPPEYVEFRQHNRSFESVGAYTVGAANLGIDHPIRPVTALVTDGLMPTLGVRPMRGRLFTLEDTLPGKEDVAILSYELWQRAFAGSEQALGRVVPVDGVSTRIVGVMPPGYDVHDQRVELWLPLTIDPAKPGGRGNHFLYLVGRLKKGLTLPQARADLDRLLAAWPATSASGRHVPNATNHRLRFDPLQEDIVGGVRRALWILQAAVGFVLLVACTNLASLFLARAESRQKEFALRAALGAGRARLFGLFLVEGLLVSLAGALAGVLLARAGLRATVAAVGSSIPRGSEVALDGRVLAFSIALSLATAFIFGVVPLLRFRGVELQDTLKDTASRATAARGRRRTRNSLVVAEVALAMVLVVGAGLMLRTFWNLLKVDAGFDRSRLVTFRLVLPSSLYKPADRPMFFRRLIDRLREVPGVQSASAMSGLPPLRRVDANDTDFEDIVPPADGERRQGPAENVDYYQVASYDYVETMGIPVVEGRGFERSDEEGPPVVLVNETLARTFFPGRSPVGRRLKPGFSVKLPWFTIVGVVKDVKQGGVDAKTGTELYLLADQAPRVAGYGAADMNVVLRTGLPLASLARTIQRAVGSADASLPVVGLRTMEEVFAETLLRPRFLAALLAAFAGFALLLAAVGTYGILSYTVTERRQEIGVRMALGASSGAVLRMVLEQGLFLVAIGLAVGLAGAVVLTRVMRSLLYGVQPADPATLIVVAAVMTAVGVLASLAPARRATRVDPIVVLKAE